MRALAVDLLDRVASAPEVLRGIGRAVRSRLRHPDEPPGKRWRVVLDGVPGAERIPDYYLVPFHGLDNGYLSRSSARCYDLGVNVFFFGADIVMRRRLLRRISYLPRRILELGCGTGTSTLLLARRFPESRIDALDLSPFYLERAERRAARAGLADRIRFHQENAEDLSRFDDGTFDLVTSTFLHHEVPVPATRGILREAFRVLEPGKQLAICDAAQEVDNPTGAAIFPQLLWEPYYAAYRRMDFEAELRAAGFCGVRIHGGFISKTVHGTRPV